MTHNYLPNAMSDAEMRFFFSLLTAVQISTYFLTGPYGKDGVASFDTLGAHNGIFLGDASN